MATPPELAPEVREALWRRWNGGTGVSQAIVLIEQRFGLRLAFEDVRRHYVRFCDVMRGRGR